MITPIFNNSLRNCNLTIKYWSKNNKSPVIIIIGEIKITIMIFLKLLRESFLFANDALKQNKLRTFLSLLGVTIGIFTIISVFSAVDTLRNNLQKSVNKLGSNSIYIQKWPWG